MVVCREQRARAESLRVLDKFGNGPGDAQPVIGAGSTPDFIEQNQAACGGAIENMCSFDHFDHERALAPGEIV